MVRKFIKNTSWVLGGNVLSKVVNFVTLGFLARVLTPDHLGYYNAVLNSGNYINMMSSVGTLIVIQRIGARINEVGKAVVSEIFSNAFTLYLGLNLLTALVVLIFPNYFFDLLLDSNGDVNYMVLICIIVVINALGQIPLYLIQGLEEFKLFSLRNLLSTFVVLIVTAVFVLMMKNNLMAAFYGLVTSYLINAILTGIVLKRIIKKFDLHIKLSFHFGILKKVMSEGFIYYLGNTFFGAIVGLVIISLFFNHLTSYEYGFTRIGSAFAVLLSIVPSAIQPVTISMLSSESAKNIYLKSLQIRIIPFFSTLVLVVISFNLELILGFMFGAKYIGAQDIVFGMVLVQIPNIYLGLINNYQVGAGHLNYIGWVAIIGSTGMIGFSVLLVPMFGIKGYFGAMYITTLIALGLMAYKEYYRTKQLTAEDWNSLFIILGLIALSYIMLYVSPNYLRIPLTLVVIIIASILFWLFCMRQEEKDFLIVESARRRLWFSFKRQ